MKKLLVGFLVLGSLSAFANTLENTCETQSYLSKLSDQSLFGFTANSILSNSDRHVFQNIKFGACETQLYIDQRNFKGHVLSQSNGATLYIKEYTKTLKGDEISLIQNALNSTRDALKNCGCSKLETE